MVAACRAGDGAPRHDGGRCVAGYSGTPLARKLGIAGGRRVAAVDAAWSGLKLVVRKALRPD